MKRWTIVLVICIVSLSSCDRTTTAPRPGSQSKGAGETHPKSALKGEPKIVSLGRWISEGGTESGSPAMAAVGRYQVMASGSTTLKIDTVTGFTWILNGAQWKAVASAPARVAVRDPRTDQMVEIEEAAIGSGAFQRSQDRESGQHYEWNRKSGAVETVILVLNGKTGAYDRYTDFPIKPPTRKRGREAK